MKKQKDGFSGQRALLLPVSMIQEQVRQESLYALLYVTDIGYYPNARYHFRERFESIGQHILIYCVSGKGWFRAHGRTYEVEANQFFILPPHAPHAYGSDENDPWTIYWVHYGGVMAGLYSSGLDHPVSIPPNVHSRISERIALFEEMYRILEMGYSRENLLYSSSVFHYFLGSLKFIRQYHNSQQLPEDSLDVVDESVRFMRENIEKKLSVREIAAYLGYSASHFTALFSARIGCPPMIYFNRLKVQKACRLLDQTDMQVNQVCFKVGITDCYYFSRLFRKEMGMSPSAYKKLKKG